MPSQSTVAQQLGLTESGSAAGHWGYGWVAAGQLAAGKVAADFWPPDNWRRVAADSSPRQTAGCGQLAAADKWLLG